MQHSSDQRLLHEAREDLQRVSFERANEVSFKCIVGLFYLSCGEKRSTSCLSLLSLSLSLSHTHVLAKHLSNTHLTHIVGLFYLHGKSLLLV